MKKVILSALVFVVLSCSNRQEDGKISSEIVNVTETANGTADKSKLPVIKFTEESYNFGKIIQGEKVSHTFTFTNEGKSNLIVASAKASCGCTVAQPPKEPIPPGGTGKIDVVFDSNGKSGNVSKSISVVTNCEPNTVILVIGGEVIEPTEPASDK
jgi:hypothetical protein